MLVHDVRGASIVNINVIYIILAHETSYYNSFISFVVIVDIVPFIKCECVTFLLPICLLLVRLSEYENLIFPGPLHLWFSGCYALQVFGFNSL